MLHRVVLAKVGKRLLRALCLSFTNADVVAQLILERQYSASPGIASAILMNAKLQVRPFRLFWIGSCRLGILTTALSCLDCIDRYK
jgi:hypothetical protein